MNAFAQILRCQFGTLEPGGLRPASHWSLGHPSSFILQAKPRVILHPSAFILRTIGVADRARADYDVRIGSVIPFGAAQDRRES